MVMEDFKSHIQQGKHSFWKCHTVFLVALIALMVPIPALAVDSPITERLRIAIGEAHKDSNKKAIAKLRETINSKESMDRDISRRTKEVALTWIKTGQTEKAKKLTKIAIDRLQSMIAKSSSSELPYNINELADFRELEAFLLEDVGNIDKAETHLKKALSEAHKLMGKRFPSKAEHNLLSFYRRHGRYSQAIELWEPRVATRIQNEGFKEPFVQFDAQRLVDLYHLNGEFDRAIALTVDLQDSVAAIFGPDHHRTLQASNAGYRVLESIDSPRYTDAVLALIDRTRRNHGSGSKLLNVHYSRLGSPVSRLTLADAERTQFRVLESLESRYGNDPENLFIAHHAFVDFQIERRRFSKARELLSQLSESPPIINSAPDRPRSVYQIQLDVSAENIQSLEKGRNNNLETLLSRMETSRKLYEYDLHDLAYASQSRGETKAAELAAREGLQSAQREAGTHSRRRLSFKFVLAQSLMEQNRVEEAFELVHPLFKVRKGAKNSVLGERNPRTTIPWHLLLAEIELELRGFELDAGQRAESAFRAAKQLYLKEGRTRNSSNDLRLGYEYMRRAIKILADARWRSVEQVIARSANQNDKTLRRQFLSDHQTVDFAFENLQLAGLGSVDRAVGEAAMLAAAERTGSGFVELASMRRDAQVAYEKAYDGFLSTIGNFTPEAIEMRKAFNLQMDQAKNSEKVVNHKLAKGLTEYAQIGAPNPIELETAKALLDEGEAALILVPTKRGTHVLAFDHKNQFWTRSDLTASMLHTRIRSLQWDVGAPIDLQAEDEFLWIDRPLSSFDRKTAHQLYMELFAPAQHILSDKRRIFVNATGSLSNLPLGILVTEPPVGFDDDAEDLRSTSWLADKSELVIIPSLRMLQFVKHTEQDLMGNEFLGFGDPRLAPLTKEQRTALEGRGRKSHLISIRGAMKSHGMGKETLSDPTMLRQMTSLPGTAIELRAIANAMGTDERNLYMQNRATESTFKSTKLTNLEILTLATHGLVASEAIDTGEPGLVFTPPDSATEFDDGYLTASEIASMQIQAGWVILSACNTAAGNGEDGSPGLSGLALASSGCRRS